jgi:acyl-CoA synthetase (AMP-forming)/AMP-acid ligase II
MEIASLADIPRRFAAAAPDRIAIQYESRATTWAEWDRQSNRIAHALEADGAGSGVRVAYLGKNSDRFFHLVFGCAKIGAVMTPINWRLSVPEICFILDDAQCRILFVGPEFASLLDAIRGECPSVRVFVAVEEASPNLPAMESWLADASDADPPRSVAVDDVVLQLYTSGTTGLPKGAQLTHRNLLFSTGLSRTQALGLWREDDICVLPMPFFHAAGIVFGLCAPAAGGMALVVREANPALIIAAVKSAPGPVTRIGLVPAVIRMLIEHPEFSGRDFASLRTLTYGGSPITPLLMRRAVEAFGPVMTQLFGMTETATVGTALLPADHDPDNPKLLTSCGRALPGVDVAVVRPDSSPAAVGESGEVVIRCEAVMAGYWNRPADSAAALENGWYHSGDIGYLDADGYLYIQDRLKDMIISGGENVYPAEVERVLIEHPAVADVGVFGVPDEKWGEAVKAAVVVKSGASLTAEGLLVFARERLGGYKCPKTFDFVEALPRNAAGKILKRRLREPYWKGEHRNVG